MYKNTASQKIVLFVFDYSTGAPKTGDAANLTAYVSKDDGSVTVLGDTSATELDATNAKGLYSFDVTQSETNADKLIFSGKSSTANVTMVPVTIYTRTRVIRKNTAFSAFTFMMRDSTTHAPKTGVTVTATRSLDGGSFAACTNSPTEIASGWYKIDLSAGDLNAKVISFRATGTGSDDTNLQLITQD